MMTKKNNKDRGFSAVFILLFFYMVTVESAMNVESIWWRIIMVLGQIWRKWGRYTRQHQYVRILHSNSPSVYFIFASSIFICMIVLL